MKTAILNSRLCRGRGDGVSLLTQCQCRLPVKLFWQPAGTRMFPWLIPEGVSDPRGVTRGELVRN